MFALKEIVAKGKVVRFVCLMAESLWYESEDGFTFPVPLSETPGASFLAEDKALMYMRHIRKYLPVATGREGELARAARGVAGTDDVTFTLFKDNELWFRTRDGFEFPVPVSALPTVAAVEALSRLRTYAEQHLNMLATARHNA